MKYLAATFFSFVVFVATAQVTFVITSLPDYTPAEDKIYIVGDFNGWNPGDVNHILTKNDDGLWETTLDGFVDGITIKYKFTRGDWAKVEKDENFNEIADREFTFGNGDTVEVSILNWADFSDGDESTAAWNVAIVDEAFYMPQLDRTRRIWIYLPPDYELTTRNYPVLYMHDGQNIFDQITSYIGEWEVDETLNDLADAGYRVPIVVGIDHGGVYRIDELTPWVNTEYGGGQGDEYMAFIVETLKPFIDANYRTIPDRENTGIMGSSLGGLISTYGALKYQEVFSKTGPFSPAYWINNDSIWDYVSETGMDQQIKFYQNAGELEGDTYIKAMFAMEDSLKSVGFSEVTSKVIDGGDHNEATWRDDFANAYLWLFDTYALDLSEVSEIKTLSVSPNPVTSRLKLSLIENTPPGKLSIMDTSGKVILKAENFKNHVMSVPHLKSGMYIIRYESGSLIYIGKFIKN